MKDLFNKNQGFTLVEIMAVVSIMAILATLLSLNLAGQRAARNIKIAQTRLVTEIRKTQSYTLSARSLPTGESVQYYILKFDLANPTQYKIQAVYNVSSQPKLVDVETISLPQDIQIAAKSTGASPINISRSPNPVSQDILSKCALVSFAAPFGKVIFNDGCFVSNPPNLASGDDYLDKIINFQNNVDCANVSVTPPYYAPSVCSASMDSSMTITLTDKYKTVSKTITINGITGSVSFN